MKTTTKKKSPLNRKETQTLLNTLKVTTIAGLLSLTLTGWGLLARVNAEKQVSVALPADAKTVALVESAPAANPTSTAAPPPTATPAAQPVARKTVKLNIVQRTSNTSGAPVAVVADNRGGLWYVMGSDVPRIEQGLQPLVQPQPVRVVTRSRAS